MKLVPEKGLIAWFTYNPVAANLMMLLIIAAGLYSMSNISKDMFPRPELSTINITAVYPGATPVDMEEGVILPMESALQGLKGVEKINATARRNVASISLDISTNDDIDEVIAQVENRIDGIVNFPQGLEAPIVTKGEAFSWVMGVAVSGDMDERTRKALGQQIYDELIALPDIKQAFLWGISNYEIAIEVKEERLRAFNLTLNDVAQVLRESFLDLPAGMIKAENGNVLVRTEGKAYTGEDFSRLILRSDVDGTQLRLTDVATIKDGFVESDGRVHFDRGRAFAIGIFALKEQDLLVIDAAVKKYIQNKRSNMPDGLSIDEYFATSVHLSGRLNMMLENLAFGTVLVAIVLTLFLNGQVALWVMVGIPISFLGAFWLMPINPYPININVLSLFAFIMVLGIVVDDAIVIGESVFSEAKNRKKNRQKENNSLANEESYICSQDTVITGVNKVAIPSTIGVLTTIAAFIPILFVGGAIAPFFESIAVVVILCLIFSLIESKLILPSHLVGLSLDPSVGSRFSFIEKWQRNIAKTLTRFIKNRYQPFLHTCLHYRYVTLSVFIAVLIIAFSLLSSGIARFEFFPNVPSDGVQASISMHEGVSSEMQLEALLAVESAAYQVDSDYLDKNPKESSLIRHLLFYTESDNQAKFMLQLSPIEERNITSIEFEKLWREEVGSLPNVRRQEYFATTNTGGGAQINLSLSGSDPEQLKLASVDVHDKLSEYEGVFDIYNSQGIGTKEVVIRLKPYASQVGVRLADVARQVRQAFQGEEVQRLQRGAETLKVMVRYPIEDRRSIATLEKMLIRTASGEAIAISDVANIDFGVGLSTISRVDRKRTVTITADVNAEKVQSDSVIEDIHKDFIPQLLKQYPSVQYGLGGSSQEQGKLQSRMLIGFVAALFMIYTLLAIPLRSYIQPLIIMSVIPFGFIGAVIGHVLFDVAISVLSLFGLVALAGVVVNDSLILIDFANRERKENVSAEEAMLIAGSRRFRAIILTTLTTFVGLLPVLFETSLQAQFVIPMALSLSFGIVSATAITLLLIPCLYLVADDLKHFKNSSFGSGFVFFR